MRARKKSPDFILFLTVIVLLSFGVISVFTSSQYASHVLFGDAFYYLKKQILWALLGTGVMIFLSNFDYWRLRKLVLPALIIAFILLIMVLIPGIGKVVNGAQRWINLGFFAFQPSEIIKLSIILFMAYGLSKKGAKIKDFVSGLLPFLVVLGLACVLILLQPDLGTAMSLAGSVFVMFIAAGARVKHLSLLGGGGVGLVILAIIAEPYRLIRIFTYLDPWSNPTGSGFQIIQSLYALGSGGVFGQGLGQSKAKFLYLPERHTDFIFAIIGEEIGFIGGVLIILLFLLFIWRGLKIAISAPDSFASILAVGLTSMVGLQAVLNLGVVTGALPTTGIPLPFISYGGTSLVFILAGVGLLLNISKYTTSK